MGNTYKQVKSNIQEAVNKKPSGNSQIGKSTNCPNCGRLFSSKTTNNSLNSHLDSCLAMQVDVQEQPVQQLQQTNPFLLNNPFKEKKYESLGAEYYWFKVLKDNNYVWERQSITSLNEPVIAQMTGEQVKNASFPEKQLWLKIQLNKRRISWQMGADHLKIDVNTVLQSSLQNINKCSLFKELKIDFIGDKVLDAGGLLREWLLLLFKELTHPSLGLFMLAETEDVCYRINPEVGLDDYFKDCFRLCGKAIGKAVFERLTLNIFLDRPFVKKLIGQELCLDDIKYFDKQLYNSWSYLLNNTINPEDLMEYFVVCKQQECIELKPNGYEILVTNENKEEYVKLCIQTLSYEFVKPTMNIVIEEIYKIVPQSCWHVFTVDEAEMILYGVPFIDVNEWKEQSEYQQPYTANHKVIKWFWQVLEELDQEQLSKFLQYCTGSSRIPVNGFSKLESNRGAYAKFKIISSKFDGDHSYPKAHTCFNRLELPLYPNVDVTRKFLKSIVNNDFEGTFGME